MVEPNADSLLSMQKGSLFLEITHVSASILPMVVRKERRNEARVASTMSNKLKMTLDLPNDHMERGRFIILRIIRLKSLKILTSKKSLWLTFVNYALPATNETPLMELRLHPPPLKLIKVNIDCPSFHFLKEGWMKLASHSARFSWTISLI